MAFERTAVVEVAGVVRILRVLQKVFEQIDGQIEISAVLITAIHLQLANQLWTDS